VIRSAGPACHLLALALAVSGCFDVHGVALMLDDFEDGDLSPSDPDFDFWECSSFNAAGRGYSCDHTDGYRSLYALVLQATVVDPLDGAAQSGGAQLETKSHLPVDLSGVTEFRFDAKLVFDAGPVWPQASLNLEIGCTKADPDAGTGPVDLFVEMQVPYQADWAPFRVPTAGLVDPSLLDPPWPNTKTVPGGPAACLARANSVRFSVDAGLMDGETNSFTLSVDNIKYR